MKEFFLSYPRSKDFRRKASEQCKPYTDKLLTITLIYLLISIAVAIIDSLTGTRTPIEGTDTYVTTTWFAGIFEFLTAGAFMFSFVLICKKVYDDKEPVVKDLFSGFNQFTRALVVNLLSSLYIFLWTLLFIIPGLVKSFSYALAKYIAIDRPELNANECITESRKIMDGHKWELFCLVFSYIGWMLLSALTLGILLLWVAPKMQQAQYLFYLHVSGKGLEDEKLKEASIEVEVVDAQ